MAHTDEHERPSWTERLGQGIEALKGQSEEERREAARRIHLEEVTKREAKEVAVEAARSEARFAMRHEVKKAVAEALAEEEEAPAPEGLSAFESMLAAYATMDGTDEGRSELIMRLYHLPKVGGTQVFQRAWTLSPDEATTEGDLDLEGKTLAWAEGNNLWGQYEWKLKGWVRGRLHTETCKRVTVQPPAGYQPPQKPTAPLEAVEPAKTAWEQVRETIELMTLLAGATGGGKGSGLDMGSIEAIRSAARAEGIQTGTFQGRLEADREWRQRAEDEVKRHRADLKDAEERGYSRGKVDGSRETHDQLYPELLELRLGAPTADEPDAVSRVIDAFGGPEGVQRLTGSLVASWNRQTPAQARPVALPAPAAKAAPTAVNPATSPAQALPVPSPLELHDAMGVLDEALEVLEVVGEHAEGEDRASAARYHAALEAFQAQASAGDLGSWWQAWKAKNEALARELVRRLEPVARAMEEGREAPEAEGEEMDLAKLEALRPELLAALEAGAGPAEVLALMDARLSAEDQAALKRQTALLPAGMLAGAIGEGQYAEVLTETVRAWRSR